MSKEKILLFIPVYNCKTQALRVAKKISSQNLSHFHKIVFIDNKSDDHTADELRNFINNYGSSELQKKAVVKVNLDNINLGGSHKVMFEYAIDNCFDFIAILHGDDQGDICDLISVLDRGHYKKTDFFMGSRFMKEHELKEYPFVRLVGNKIFNFIFSILLRQKIYDLGSGLNIFKVSCLSKKFYENFPNDLTFNYFFIAYVAMKKFSVDYFSHSWSETDQRSNLKFVRNIKVLLKLIYLIAIKSSDFNRGENNKLPKNFYFNKY